jgi:hypothetical protein
MAKTTDAALIRTERSAFLIRLVVTLIAVYGLSFLWGSIDPQADASTMSLLTIVARISMGYAFYRFSVVLGNGKTVSVILAIAANGLFIFVFGGILLDARSKLRRLERQGDTSATPDTTAARVHADTELRTDTATELSTATVDSAPHKLVRNPTPEEEELSEKQDELARLQTELVERELELATFSAELQSFEHRYYRTVGVRMARLDTLEAEIAECLADGAPNDPAAGARATAARERARESAAADPEARSASPSGGGPVSPELRRLYHELARMVHPDLTTDEVERGLRTSVMMDVNDAYCNGDLEAVQRLRRRWADRPESVQGTDTSAEMLRTQRRIALVRDRMQAITQEQAALTDSELYRLKARVDEAAREGEDLLATMAADLDTQISSAQTRLAALHYEGERR